MTSGENIHNAFLVVFQTLKSIEKLMKKCRAELDEERYYMPMERFMRYSSDLTWEGWIYWSFILLFQRKEDGPVMENGWINGPVYAVEINVDPDTCETPQLIVTRMDFDGIPSWSKGCSPANHTLFYNAIHEEELQSFWGLSRVIKKNYELTDVKQGNYNEMIFGTIETLSQDT